MTGNALKSLKPAPAERTPASKALAIVGEAAVTQPPAKRELPSKDIMFTSRMTEHTAEAVARAAKAAGKTQRQFLAEILSLAGLDVHPEDLKDRPRRRSRA